MRLTTLEKRVTTLETMLTHPTLNRSVHQTNDVLSLQAQLEELIHEAKLIKEKAEAAGDHRALACLRAHYQFLELACKLRGELDETPRTNILNVNLDPEIAKRIAETYLARHRALELDQP